MQDVDVVVIGSGAGGLTAAAALAQAGKRVVVFEQHYLPGGWCQSFSLQGYRFSPGVHYIGELGDGGRTRRLFEGLGLGPDLTFYELNPDAIDHMVIGSERFDIPKGRERFVERLSRRFPREQAGIRGYFETVERMVRELDSMMEMGPAELLALPWRAPTVARWGLRTADRMIRHHVHDPLLRAILGGQAGDHGVPLSRVSAAVHASITNHYLTGGYYPKGGGRSLPRALIRTLQRAGGAIRVRTPVAEIMTERGRALGVRLQDGTTVRARHVISNADPGVTFGRLLSELPRSLLLRQRLRRTRYSTSSLSLFLAADVDVRERGLDSGNYWYYGDADIDRIYRTCTAPSATPPREVPAYFLTITTQKDPSKSYGGGVQTMEAFTFTSYDSFQAWSASTTGQRAGAYEALKSELTDAMLRAVGKLVPGIEQRVVFSELGTPLTNQYYLASSRGNIYGTEKSRFQVGPFAFPVRSGIDGLLLVGASTLSHGVMGASLSGLVAAKEIIGCSLDALLSHDRGPITVLPAEPAPVTQLAAA